MSTPTAVRIVCPEWCERSMAEHLETLETEGGIPWHRGGVVHGEGWEVRIMQSRFMDGSVDPDDAGEVAAEAYLKLDSETHEAFIAATRAAVARLQRSRPS